MTDDAQPISLEELLSHQAWVKGLARSLLFDQARVDDVVQETWLVALKRPAGEPSKIRGWLGGIVRNVARNERRGARRRVLREERSAVFDGAAATVDLVARAELQRLVIAAVLALEEPYRSTVLMHWFEELSSAEIARRLGVPDATIRARCRRALNRLRETLDAQTGDGRRQWSLALLPLALPSLTVPVAAAASTLTTLTGALVMSLKWKLTIGLAVLLLTVGGAWWVLQDADPEVGGAAVVSARRADDSSLSVAGMPLPDAVSGASVESLHAAAREGLRNGNAAADGAAARLVFTGRVVTDDGLPLVRAEVGLRPWWVPRASMLDSRRSLTTGPDPQLSWVRTDEQGEFRIEADRSSNGAVAARPGSKNMLYVKHPAVELTTFAYPELTVAAQRVGDLVVQAAASVIGRVVDETGRPLEGADLVSPGFLGFGGERSRDWSAARPFFIAESGPDGRFRLDSLWAVHQEYSVSLAGYQPGSLDVEPETGRTTDIGDVVLITGRRLAGRVVDAAGRGVPDALVIARPSQMADSFSGRDTAQHRFSISVFTSGLDELRVRTEADGRFDFDTVAQPFYMVVAGLEGWEPAMREGVAADTLDLELVLRAAASLVVHVADDVTGAALKGAAGVAKRLAGVAHNSTNPSVRVSSGYEALKQSGLDRSHLGVLFLRGVGHYGTELAVTAPGYAASTFLLPGVEAPGRLEHTVVMTPQALVTGSVYDSLGNACASAEVTLRLVDGSQPQSAASLDKQKTATTEDGSYEFVGLPAGLWMLSATAEGHAPTDAMSIRTFAAETTRADVLVLRGAAHIGGVLLASDGTPAAGHRLSLHGPAIDTGALKMTTTGTTTSYTYGAPSSRFTATTGSDGRFLFGDLQPGDYQVKAQPGVDVHVATSPGETAELELQLAAVPGISGFVRDANGPVVGAIVWLQAGQRGELARFRTLKEGSLTDEHGAYQVYADRPGSHTLFAELDGGWSEPVELELGWGSAERVDFRLGGLSLGGLVVDGSTGRGVAGATVKVVNETRAAAYAESSARSLLFRATVSTDEDGRFQVEHLLPGRHVMSIRSADFVPLELAPLFLEDGTEPEKLRAVLDPGASLAVQLIAEGGGPLDALWVCSVVKNDDSGFRRRTETSVDGHALLNGLGAGSYTLRAERDVKGSVKSQDAVSQTVVLSAGERAQVELVVPL